jgi:hypothetical protein
MRATVNDAIAERIPTALNLKSTDSRFYSYLNIATRRLLYRGKYWGTYARYKLPASSQIFTLPPYLDTVERIAISRLPTPLRDLPWEFLETGWGTRDDTQPNGSGLSEVLYRGNFPTSSDITTPGVLTVKCDFVTDVGKIVTILGYDNNGNWVRRQVSGVYYDGEQVALAQGAGTNTATLFAQVTDILAPANLDGQWWLYQATQLLGNYQYWDTKPSWKRYLIPFLDSTNTFIEIVGKKAFIPVKYPTDFLVIGNMAALRLGCMAVKAEEETMIGMASLLWNGGMDKDGNQVIGAIQEMDNELSHHLGDGVQRSIEVLPMAGWETVETLV